MSDLRDSLPIWRFGVFEMEGRTGELRRNGLLIKLQEQPSRLLLFLLENAGEIITRDDLRRRLWPVDIFVDYDHALNASVMKLREALDDSTERPIYIQTIPRKGYRFIAPVDRVQPHIPDDSAAASNNSVLTLIRTPELSKVHSAEVNLASEILPSTPGGKESDSSGHEVPSLEGPASRWRMWRVMATVGVVICLSVVLIEKRKAGFTDLVPSGLHPIRIRSLAVLPLDNLSNDPEQEYFADGMTAEIITELAKTPGIRVISRTSSMQYKRVHKPLRQIARELKVDAVVEGEVIRSQNRVRVTAQLIDTAHDRHLWAETYMGDIRDVVALQGKVAQAIANAIRIEIAPTDRARLRSNHSLKPDAYEAYLRGRYFLEKRTGNGISRAVDLFQQAISRDPQYAQAYSAMAKAYDLAGTYELVPPAESFPKVREAADRALQLDPTLSEAYAARGLAASMYEHDWAAAERDFQQALALNSNDATAHHWYAEHLVNVGQAEHALSELKEARELDPLSLPISGTLGRVYRDAHRYLEAREQCQKTLELDPNFALGHWCLGVADLALRRYSEAIEEMRRAAALSSAPIYEWGLGYAYAVAGNLPMARSITETLKHDTHSKYVPAYFIGTIYGAMGEKDQAFAWLQKACDERDSQITSLLFDPFVDPLRSDVRFQALVRKVGLPQ